MALQTFAFFICRKNYFVVAQFVVCSYLCVVNEKVINFTLHILHVDLIQ